MATDVQIEQLNSIGESLSELTELLVSVVNDGASVGFLPPMKQTAANDYWKSTLNPEVRLFAARVNNRIAGSVQLHLCSKENGLHRAEIAKLMTHPDFRRRGIAHSLMQAAEELAKREGRSLLVLDTRENDPSNCLYSSMGYVQAGRIPDYAKSAAEDLTATIIYYKKLS